MSDGSDGFRRKFFSTANLPQQEQYDAWSELAGKVSDLERNEVETGGFHAQLAGFELDGLSVVSWCLDPFSFHRTAACIRSCGLDHWVLSFVRRGRMISDCGDRILDERPGTFVVKSLWKPISAQARLDDHVSVYLSRDAFPELATALDTLHHQCVDTAPGRILQSFVFGMVDNIFDLTSQNTKALSQSFSLLLSAAIAPNAEVLQNAEGPVSACRLQSVKNFIDANLTSPDLDVGLICRTLRISRRSLYYIFEPEGGVAKYIRMARLQACYNALSDMSDHRLISTIAFEHGFGDMSGFSKQFKSAFGVTPKEVRNAGVQEPVPSLLKRSSFLDQFLVKGSV